MDRAVHARFLTYLETWPYFREPGATRLSASEFAALDAELRALEQAAERDATQEARRRALRRALMLD